MSSVTSSFAQIEKRTKFLLTTASTTGIVVDGLYSVIADDALGTGITDLSGSSLQQARVTIGSGALLKDLGRQITIVDSDNNLVTNVYRQVQQVNGAGTEGVGGNPDLGTAAAIYGCSYVKVFNDAGAGVTVVRTG